MLIKILLAATCFGLLGCATTEKDRQCKALGGEMQPDGETCIDNGKYIPLPSTPKHHGHVMGKGY